MLFGVCIFGGIFLAGQGGLLLRAAEIFVRRDAARADGRRAPLERPQLHLLRPVLDHAAHQEFRAGVRGDEQGTPAVGVVPDLRLEHTLRSELLLGKGAVDMIRGLHVPLQKNQQGVPERLRHRPGDDEALEGRHDGHGEEHPGWAPDVAEESNSEEDDHRVHPHQLVTLHQLHLHNITEQKLQEPRSHHRRKSGAQVLAPIHVGGPVGLVAAPDAAVEENRGDAEHTREDRADLGDVVEKEGDHNKQPPGLHAHGVQEQSNCRRVQNRGHRLEGQILPEQRIQLAVDGQRLEQP
mmetsp:Transcript_34487/g.89899  ORF Transcript_34487/g.89899 Transcript_34487/m.89899 type:complete len:295 (-) Transcript_34487:339-1223(-)